MNSLRFVVAVTTVFLTASSFSAEQSSTEEAMRVARQTCLTAAQQQYGSAEVTSKKGKKKKINRKRGYAFAMKVRGGKRVNCMADSDGGTMFYRGQR